MAKKKITKKQQAKLDQSEFLAKAYEDFQGLSRPQKPKRQLRRFEEWKRIKPLKPVCQENETFGEFFPKQGQAKELEKARDHCKACPLFFVCVEDQLLYPDVQGVRGGMAARERKNIRADIGTKALNALADLPITDPVRERFYQITKIAMSNVVLGELSVTEAAEALHAIPMRITRAA